MEDPEAVLLGRARAAARHTKGIPLVTGTASWITPLECCAFKILWGRVVSHPPSFADCPSAGGWNIEFGEEPAG